MPTSWCLAQSKHWINIIYHYYYHLLLHLKNTNRQVLFFLMKRLYSLLFPYAFLLSISFLWEKGRKIWNFPSKIFATMCPLSQARKERVWLSFSESLLWVWKNRSVTFIIFRIEYAAVLLVCHTSWGCSQGLKTEFRRLAPCSQHHSFSRWLHFKYNEHFECTPFLTNSWSSPPDCELLEGRTVSSL